MRVAAVDIGTNTVRLLVADVDGGGVTEVERAAVVTGLGRGVDATRRFDPERVAATLDALARHRATMERLGVERARAVATSATRDVADREAFLDAVEATLGVRPEVIPGPEEARLGFTGVTRAAPDARLPGPVVVVDVGGGSTEFAWGGAGLEGARSIDIGSVRLTDRVLGEPPPSPAVVDEARRVAAALLAPVAEVCPVPASAVGVGGTVTTLAAMEEAATGVPAVELSGDVLAGWIRRLAGMTLPELAELPGLDPARAPVILGGAIVFDEALSAIGAAVARVSRRDLLDGIALELATRRSRR